MTHRIIRRMSTTHGLSGIVPPGVATGDNLIRLLRYARDNNFALPAVNCTTSSTINAVLEAARDNQAPVMIQFSNGGCGYYAGQGFSNNGGQRADVAGAVAAASHVRIMAEKYGVPVVLCSDHCSKKLLPWFDGMLEANEEYYKVHGEPLFSGHMLDLSEETIEENLEICKHYLKRMSKMGLLLEMELGITGGEEDGVDNTGVDISELYSKPEEIYQAYKELTPISHRFTVAAAFGNVHGVYKAGNVKLEPEILGNAQKYIREKTGSSQDKPVFFVFHGGSGSSDAEIKEAISYGVIKMNIDTDLQWAYWNGVREYAEKNHDYLQGQIGNPEGDDSPNKNYYDPRKWIRCAEQAMAERLIQAFTSLGAKGKLNSNVVILEDPK